jgi:hypothetical protein
MRGERPGTASRTPTCVSMVSGCGPLGFGPGCGRGAGLRGPRAAGRGQHHLDRIRQLLRSEPLARSRWMSRCAEDGISPGILDATEGPMTAAHYLAPLLRPLQNSAVTVCAGGR